MEPHVGAVGRVGQLDWLLDDLVRRVAHISKAVILSQEGADLGLVAYEMAVLVRRSGEHIRVNTRASAVNGWA